MIDVVKPYATGRDAGAAALRGLEDAVRAHPYASVTLAAGAGYVLSGALLTPFTMRVLRFAARNALRFVVLPAILPGGGPAASR